MCLVDKLAAAATIAAVKAGRTRVMGWYSLAKITSTFPTEADMPFPRLVEEAIVLVEAANLPEAHTKLQHN